MLSDVIEKISKWWKGGCDHDYIIVAPIPDFHGNALAVRCKHCGNPNISWVKEDLASTIRKRMDEGCVWNVDEQRWEINVSCYDTR
jgi:hypothetical protein